MYNVSSDELVKNSFRCDLDSDYKVGNNWAETH